MELNRNLEIWLEIGMRWWIENESLRKYFTSTRKLSCCISIIRLFMTSFTVHCFFSLYKYWSWTILKINPSFISYSWRHKSLWREKRRLFLDIPSPLWRLSVILQHYWIFHTILWRRIEAFCDIFHAAHLLSLSMSFVDSGELHIIYIFCFAFLTQYNLFSFILLVCLFPVFSSVTRF